MASAHPVRVTTDHTNAPDPKPAKGVKIAFGMAALLAALVVLALWAMVQALG